MISIDLTAIDKKVIARKNQAIDADFIECLLQMAPEPESAGSAIVETPIMQHLQMIMEMPDFRHILKKEKRKNDLIENLQTIIFPERLIDELLWMQRFEYVYHHTLVITLLVAVLSLDLFTNRTERRLAMAASLTHDFGITRIPKAILDKPGRLDEQEFQLIREHPVYSFLLLSYYFSDSTNPLAQTAFVHHEDGIGTGYPKGFKQENSIALLIRMCDIYDALKTARPFRPAMTTEQALGILQEETECGKIPRRLFDRLQTLVGV